ncbi:hypothetical protein CFI00_08295 [Nocardioides sp. S5]|uniref:recombinase family protein n=1 Tax=Nocardioides sp. S5 TaxID=2017486 RepID=UPI001A8C763C|nr:recombinase family protein [Nocardioides sp. S5]QSR30504.1 hypothetical protein CFI00_08295 [Nocardioides sp. S5]
MDAVIYARISRDSAGEALGVTRQIQDCTHKAEALGWTVVDRYVDNDVSASKNKVRPQYEKMLQGIETGDVSAIVVYDLDRLTRKPMELESFILLAERYAVELANVSGDVDLTTANGKMVARIKGAVARQEADRIAERTARQKAQALADGRPLGGRYRLFGFNRDWSVNDGEAAIVREVFSRARSGESHGSISRDLREREVRTVTGGRWVPLQTARLLRTQRYAGRSVHNGKVVGNSQVTPLVSEVDFEAVQRPTPGQTRGRARKYLLSGFLVCGACKATMSGSNGRYRCDPATGGCGTVGIKADWVDWPLSERVASLHQQVRVSDPFESRDYQGELDEVDRRISVLHERHQAGDLDLEDLVILLKEERQKRKVTVASLAEDTSDIDQLLRGLEEFETADVSVKREIVARYVKYVVIEPSGKGRQPHQSRGRINVVWRNNSTENLLTDTPRLDYRWVL